MEIKDKKDMERYRVKRAWQTMTEDEDNAKLGHWNLTAGRLYYALFYMSTALLLDKGIGTKSHAGVISYIGKEFVLPGMLTREEARLISALQNMRHQGDYDDFNQWTEQDVTPLFKPTRDLLKKMESFLTLI